MLKRIVVVAEDKKLLKAAEKAVANHDDVVLSTDTAATHGVVGVLGSAASAADALGVLASAAREHDALFKLLAEAIDAREGHKGGSCLRLADHAVRLGKAIGLSGDELVSLERGALLHDIGKIVLSNEVLMKKSVLSYDEWLDLQAHTTKGMELLRDLGFEQPVLDIVHFHHECFDGDGYPKHLEGEGIPLLARIMKICDVFTAMTSPRHYRPGVPTIDDGVEQLRAERGKHFDPALVDAFLAHEIGRPWA